MSEEPKKNPGQPGHFLSADVMRNEDGQATGINLRFNTKQAILFFLQTYLMNGSLSQSAREEIQDVKDYLEEHLVSMDIFPMSLGGDEWKGMFKMPFNCFPDNLETAEQIKRRLDSPFVKFTVARMLGQEKDFFRINKISPKKKKELRGLPTGGAIKQRGKFKAPGHFIDQKLKYNQPGAIQPTLFDMLAKQTQDKIIKAGVSLELINKRGEGIKLSRGEYKLIDCICELLHEKSQNSSPDKENYYTGNQEAQVVPWGRGSGMAPKLAVTLYELTKKYKGGDSVGGQDIENVRTLLIGLEEDPEKRALIRYTRETQNAKGGRTKDEVEEFQSLLKLQNIRRTEYSPQDIVTSQKEEVAILLNPIFRDQIETKFVTYPKDINRRMIQAYGNQNISEIAYRLRDWLARALSSKNLTPEINLENLYWTLAEDYMRGSRRKLVKDFTDKAIETVKRLGLLEKHEITTGKSGQQKVKFYLNKEWN